MRRQKDAACEAEAYAGLVAAARNPPNRPSLRPLGDLQAPGGDADGLSGLGKGRYGHGGLPHDLAADGPSGYRLGAPT